MGSGTVRPSCDCAATAGLEAGGPTVTWGDNLSFQGDLNALLLIVKVPPKCPFLRPRDPTPPPLFLGLFRRKLRPGEGGTP